ncbi:MAG TPA: protein kinase, partial [Bryobacteraceae bacterium]
MDPDWQRINDLYYAALERPLDERARFLNEACPAEDGVRREVQSLLRYERLDFELLDNAEGAPRQRALRPSDFPKSLALKAGTSLGSYRIRECLGAGGMGEVYLADDLKLNREVAIKVLPASSSDSVDTSALITREAQVLARMNHPNIGAIYGLEEADGVRALVLELVDGPTLADRIRQGPLPVDEALVVARQIIEALEYAHEKGIIHRDLKPANIKITADDKTKVLDFGLAEWSKRDSDSQDDPESGLIAGTPHYMSPEQVRGKNLDRRSDVWAFGAVLFEMLTGRPAFPGKNVSETLLRVLTTDPDWNLLPRDTPVEVRRLLESCLRKDPRSRLRDIGDAHLLLERADELVVAGKPSPKWLMWGLAAALVVAVCLAIVSLRFRTPAETAVMRWSIQPPADVKWISHAISPDGRQIAFTAQKINGKITLWIRRLDDSNAVELPGTEGATYPFWSPESRFVGFFTEGSLKRVDAGGGTPQVVCACHAGRGGAWASDGTILFSQGSSGVFTVPTGGGDPKPLTQLDSSRKEAGHYWPLLLPDGKHFLYTALSARADVRGIWAASLLHPKERHRLVSDQSRSAYASGRLLFVREKVLMGLLLDSTGMEVHGDPSPVAEGVFTSLGMSSGAAGFSVSSNGVLVLGGSTTGAKPSLLTWFDRTGKRLGTVGSAAPHLRAMLSPDQSRIVVDLPDTNRALDLHILDLRRGTNSRLTFDPAFETGPVWSPDGQSIAFASNRNGTYDLYKRLSTGAGEPQLLLHTEENKYPTDWSRDGRYILFVETDTRTREDIWALDLKTGVANRFLQTEFREMAARFSPDGRWIAYTSDESTKTQVYVQSFPLGTTKWQISSEGGD